MELAGQSDSSSSTVVFLAAIIHLRPWFHVLKKKQLKQGGLRGHPLIDLIRLIPGIIVVRT